MNHLVLDASVALKWFLLSEAPWEIQALGLLARYKAKEFELVVPDLFSGEFGNVLFKTTRQGRFTLSEEEGSLAELKNWGYPRRHPLHCWSARSSWPASTAVLYTTASMWLSLFLLRQLSSQPTSGWPTPWPRICQLSGSGKSDLFSTG